MELQSKPVDFSNHIAFVDLEANMVTNPVLAGSLTALNQRLASDHVVARQPLKEPENLSLLTQVDGCGCFSSEKGLPDASGPSTRDYRE